MSLIHKAAYCGNYDQLLDELNNEVDPNYISTRFSSKYTTCFNKKINIYFQNMYPLYLAVQGKHLSCVKLLMNRGANPNLVIYNEYCKSYCTAINFSLLNLDYKCYNLLKNKKNKGLLHEFTYNLIE